MSNFDIHITAQQCLASHRSPYDEMNIVLLQAVKNRYEFLRTAPVDRLVFRLALPNFNNTTLDFPVVFIKTPNIVARVAIHKNIFYGSLKPIFSSDTVQGRWVEDSSSGCYYWTAPVVNQWSLQVAHQKGDYVTMQDVFEILAGRKKHVFNITPFLGGKK